MGLSTDTNATVYSVPFRAEGEATAPRRICAEDGVREGTVVPSAGTEEEVVSLSRARKTARGQWQRRVVGAASPCGCLLLAYHFPEIGIRIRLLASSPLSTFIH